ncbi:hypothetical protein HG531_001611 [Fusarium graminearum]|nr:hypothetical protein HG531_001611 [Fusarium graminearum]
MDESLVSGHNFWRDVDLSIVAHDRIESPEELARRILGLILKLSAYLANGINGFSTWDVTGKHHVKVIQRDLVGEADADVVGQAGSLAEVDKILEREYTSELHRGHLDSGSVLGIGDTQVLLVNVHELEVVLADTVVLDVLELEVQHIRAILSLECKDILVLGSTENFGERCEVHTERDIAVAAERREGFGVEHHGHESNVGVIHSLELNASVITVEVAVLHQVLDRIDHLLEKGGLVESCFQHF